MFVVGTAGHVDHGKTALISALTGIDPDRLPEEKARGMTTDLGFAYFENPEGECVGVVDVPGHERFLRNMAAGAWGLDLALLVVAADDGWMAQSRTHTRILASLSSAKVILVVTKIDAAGMPRSLEVGRESRELAFSLLGFRPEVRLVSSRTGEGIRELKAAILAALFPDRRVFSGKPYLFVDRIFGLAGAGTVIAGTLRGGDLSVKDELVLWPSGEGVRIRSLESYKKGAQSAKAVSRTALAIAKLKTEPKRGDLLAGEGLEVLSDTEFLCRLEPLPGESGLIPLDEKGKPLLRPGMEAELVLGSAHRDSVVSPYRTQGYLRVVCSAPLACPTGQRFALLRRGGTELLARGRVLAAGVTDIQRRRALDAALAGVEELAVLLRPRAEYALDENAAVYSYRWALDLRSRGWVMLPKDSPTSEPSAGLPGLETVQAGAREFAFLAQALTAFGERAARAADKPGGAGRSELESALGLPEDACGAILSLLTIRGILQAEGPRWIKPGPPRPLGKEEARLVDLLIRAGAEGVEPGRNVTEQDSRILKVLCALGRAVSLDSRIFLHRSIFEGLAQSILAGRSEGERFSVGEAKERSGLSRKFVLPLLNRMESEGLVKRDGDVRVVLAKGGRG